LTHYCELILSHILSNSRGLASQEGLCST